MTAVTSTTCKTCGTAIFFGLMPTEVMSPFDAAPSARGTWRVAEIVDAACSSPRRKLEIRAGTAIMAQADPDFDGVRYVSHFATCRDAAAHRKPKVALPMDLGL